MATHTGTVEGIQLHGERGAPMRPVDELVATEGAGIAGDRLSGLGIPGSDLTLVAAEVVEAMVAATGIPLTPGETRRNVVTRGVDLEGLVGRRFRIGEVTCRGVKPCTPCSHLESVTHAGVRAGLAAHGGGGLRADVLTGGRIRIGDRVEALAD